MPDEILEPRNSWGDSLPQEGAGEFGQMRDDVVEVLMRGGLTMRSG